MAFTYLEFQGKKHEDMEDFLEKMEIECITNHGLDPAKVLCLIQICLKGDA